MKLVLDNNELEIISQEIADNYNDEQICIDFNGVEIVVEYDCDVSGYIEDDYFSGTGAYIVTGVDLTIKNLFTVDMDLDVEYDSWKLVNITESKIMEQ